MPDTIKILTHDNENDNIIVNDFFRRIVSVPKGKTQMCDQHEPVLWL